MSARVNYIKTTMRVPFGLGGTGIRSRTCSSFDIGREFSSSPYSLVTPVIGPKNVHRSPRKSLQLIAESASLIIRVLVAILLDVYHLIVPKTLKPVGNKIVLITGAAQGIGKELARQYGHLGAKVICVDIDSAKNQETVKELEQRGIKAFSYSCDISNLQEVVNLAERVKKDVGIVDILVNNAGIAVVKRLLDHSEQDIRSLFGVNILSQFWMLKAFLPDMMKNRGGHVVAVSSMSGLIGVDNLTGYASTKHAVRGLINSVRKECVKDGVDVQFTTVYPFFVATAMNDLVNPMIRFPWLLPILVPSDVASDIIAAQRRGSYELLLPKFFNIGLFLMERLPHSAQAAIMDYLCEGCKSK